MSGRVSKIALGLAVILALGGCQSKPLVSEIAEWGYEDRFALQDWTGEQADAAIAATGLPEGWAQEDSDPPRYWETERMLALVKAPSEYCRFGGPGEPRPERLQLSLRHEGLPEHLEIAEKVRELWIADGWDVIDVVRPQDVAEYPYLLFRADKPDGRGLAFRASERVFYLTVLSACSDDVSMAR